MNSNITLIFIVLNLVSMHTLHAMEPVVSPNERTRLLPKPAPTVQATPNTALTQTLIEAAEHNDLKTVRTSLEHGAEINGYFDGTTALMSACMARGKTQPLIDLLLEHKADVTLTNEHGQTPLHRAIVYPNNNVAILESFKKAHGDLNTRSHLGSTPCHTAVYVNRLDVIIWLGNAGADMNIFNTKGQTPLHAAVYFEKKSVVDLLLRHGARLSAKTRTNCIEKEYAPERTIVPAGSTVFHLAAKASLNGLPIKRILLYHGLLHPQGTPLLPKALFTFWCCMQLTHPEKVSILKSVLTPYLMQNLSPKTIKHFLGSSNDLVRAATQRLLQQRLDFIKALFAAEDENGNTAHQIEYRTISFKPGNNSGSLIAESCYDGHLKEFAQAAQNDTIIQLPPDNVLKVAYDVALEMEDQRQVTQSNTGDR